MNPEIKSLQSLPSDVQRRFALQLSPPDLINLCLASKQQMANICNSKEFWLKKLELDYPEALLITYRDKLPLINPKRTYIRKFQEVSKVIEELERLSGFKYKTLYSIYEDLFKGAEQAEKSPGVIDYTEKIRINYDIPTTEWVIIFKELAKLIGKQLRYRREAEELKRYL